MNIWIIIPTLTLAGFVWLAFVILRQKPRSAIHKAFLSFIGAVIVWALSCILGLSNYLPAESYLPISVKINLLALLWLFTSYYHVLRLYQNKSARKGILIGYGLIPLLTPFMLGDFIIQNVIIDNGAPYPDMSIAIYPVAIVYLTILGSAIAPLLRHHNNTSNPIARNRNIYVLLGFAIMLSITMLEMYPPIGKYPLVHLGNLANAACLTYAIARYQLFDINLVVRRSMVYVLLGITLTTIYFGILFGLLRILNLSASAITILASVGIAFWIVGLTYPLRNCFQEQVEKRFFKEAYVHRLMLRNFSPKLGNSLNLLELSDQLLVMTCNALRTNNVSLFLQNKSGDFVAHNSNPAQTTFIIRGDSPIISWLYSKSHSLSTDQIDTLPVMKALWESERREINNSGLRLFFSIRNHNRLVGILALGPKINGSYSAEDIYLVTNAAAEISVILDNALLYQESLETAQMSEMLAELGKTITSSLDIQNVYHVFATQLKQILNVNWVSISLIDEGENLRLLALSSEIDPLWNPGDIIPLKGTATQWVAFHEKTHYQSDLAHERLFWPDELLLNKGVRSIIRLPLCAHNDITGTFDVASSQTHAFSPKDIEFLEQLSIQVSLAVENARLYSHTELRAISDANTDLFNHRHFHERLDDEISRGLRHNRFFTLIMMDLDFFKLYNDTYGHFAGDEALKTVSQCMKNSLRAIDVPCRYGGEEFAIILPETLTNEGIQVAERIRTTIENESKAKGTPVTVSLGVASWPADSTTKEGIIKAADSALYDAKHAGRNRTHLYTKDKPEHQAITPVSAAPSHANNSTLFALVAAIEARDPYTSGHSWEVCEYVTDMAHALRMPQETISPLRTAALLHDIGKIGISDQILRKPSPLNDEEWKIIKEHPVIGANILRLANNFADALPIVLHHHEHYDGSGYPDGLAGEDIPLESRMMVIADAFDAMVSDRPYRDALPVEIAIQELRQKAGTQFDPDLVKVFTNMIERSMISTI